MDKVVLNNRILSLSESDDGLTLQAKFLICPLDESNLNGVGLKNDDLTDAEKAGLKNQPIVAKVIKNVDGEFDFSGHNLKKVYEYNEDTNKLEVKYIFDTYPIGIHTQSYVEELDVDGAKKQCIVADCLFWTRYENAIKILKRLYDENNLHSSWEISYGESYQEDGVKWLKNILWLGNCVLGSTVNPAYPIAGALEVSSLSSDEKEFIEAFTEDVIKEQSNINNSNITSEIDKDIEEDNKINNDIQGGIQDMSEKIKEIVKETSSLTDNDIYSKVRSAINSTDDNWYYISMLYPYEFRAIAYTWNREKEEDFIEFSYSVNSDDTVSINSKKDVQMVFIPKETMVSELSEKDNKIVDLEKSLSEKETELSSVKEDLDSKVTSIAELGTKISELESQVSELTPFKEQIEKAESERKEAEMAQKKESLKVLATKGGYITSEELETSEELKKAIEDLDEKAIKAEIASRVIAKLEQAEEEKVKTVETSSTEGKENIIANLSNAGEETYSAIDIMKKRLGMK